MTSEARDGLVVAALALIVALAGVFTLPVLDRDEARFAQASLQMLERSDFIDIRFQDAPRHKKPAGAYWLQAGAAAMLAPPPERAIWAYRLPSVLAAVLGAWLCWRIGQTLFDARAALIGGALFAASLVLGAEAGIAKADALLCASVCAAMAGLAHLRFVGPSPVWATIIWAALGASVLIKGPVGPMVIGLAVLTLTVWERRAAWLRPLASFWGPFIATVIALPWFVAVQIATDGAFLATAIGEDLAPKLAGGQESHGAPVGTHAALAPLLVFPITIALAPALVSAWRAARSSPRADTHAPWRFLIAWTAPAWLVFELAPTKLAHYTLPLHAALALMVGAAICAGDRFPASRRVSAVLTALVGLLLAAVCLGLGIGSDGVLAALDPPFVLTVISVGSIGALSLTAAICVWRDQRMPAVCFAVAAALCVHGGVRGLLAPQAGALWVSARLDQALWETDLHPRGPGERAPLGVYGFSEPSLIFLTRTDTRLFDTPQAAAEALAAGELSALAVSVAVTEDPRETAIGALGAPVRALNGLNYSKGQMVRVSLFGPPAQTEPAATAAAPAVQR
ncbi:MAG: ArnT family glycosyltransferase [Maricaulaceae bacterium]